MERSRSHCSDVSLSDVESERLRHMAQHCIARLLDGPRPTAASGIPSGVETTAPPARHLWPLDADIEVSLTAVRRKRKRCPNELRT
jgi:hypothetical protein